MFARGPFQSATQTAIPVQSGDHRRHIISFHLMRQALEGWCNANGVDHGTRSNLAQMLQVMNNYIPNLHPGNGAVNTAIGMFTNNAARTVNAQNFGTPQELGERLGNYRGFQVQTQHELIDPVLAAFNTSDVISGHMEAATTFAFGLVDSTDFDWPEGANPAHWQAWESVYQLLLSLQKRATEWPVDGVNRVINMFLSLPDPMR